ncbi:hypothetical protein IU500_21180 [Nocardia terpenica]|uniref:hypothetical protein n=1 Tax=Nocardia terpenica TaxID=455432 RepID=UPI001893B765|nr:hypothetical protein [Nocardia terpenica]MBF6064218.1 hypothetical protein [Nocardia terpenica]MBF6106551.1 hypothetical protein [Nocardia terpenica]MBF6113836.1 hypothetical protein [Nocardia terpenica]MBF6120540.1 hypothetical protein [Nocardia terpenica]MBF6154803.1 hypothetical protein [Nocardia terpenica]
MGTDDRPGRPGPQRDRNRRDRIVVGMRLAFAVALVALALILLGSHVRTAPERPAVTPLPLISPLFTPPPVPPSLREEVRL